MTTAIHQEMKEIATMAVLQDLDVVQEKVKSIAKRLQSLPIQQESEMRQEFIQMMQALEKQSGMQKVCDCVYKVYCQELLPIKQQEGSSNQQSAYLPLSFYKQPSYKMRAVALCETARQIFSKGHFAPEHLWRALYNVLQAIKEDKQLQEDVYVKIAIIQIKYLVSFNHKMPIIGMINTLLEKEPEKFGLSSDGLYQTLDVLIDENPVMLHQFLESTSNRIMIQRKCYHSWEDSSILRKVSYLLLFFDPAYIEQHLSTLPSNLQQIMKTSKVDRVSGLSGEHLIALIDKVGVCCNIDTFRHLHSLFRIEFRSITPGGKLAISPKLLDDQLKKWIFTYRGAHLDFLFMRYYDQFIKDFFSTKVDAYKYFIKCGSGQANMCENSVEIATYVTTHEFSQEEWIELLKTQIIEHPVIALEKRQIEWVLQGRSMKRMSDLPVEVSLFFDPKMDRDRVLLSPLQEIVTEIYSNEKTDFYVKQTLLQWIGYAEIARKEIPPLAGTLELEMRILKEIEQVQFPTLRYLLTKRLYLALQSQEQIEGLKQLHEKQVFKKRQALFSLLLVPLIVKDSSGKLTYFIKTLQNDYFKDVQRVYAVLDGLYHLLEEDLLSEEEKIDLLSMSVPSNVSAGQMTKKEVAKKTFSNLLVGKCFLAMRWVKDLTAERAISDINEALNQRFSLVTGIGRIENFEEKYIETFAKFRDLLAVFTYAGKIMEANFAPICEALKRCVEAILNQTWYQERYEKEPNGHLQKIFDSKPGFKELWTQGFSADLSVFITQESSLSGELDIGEYLRFRIVDGHISRDKIPFLDQYLQGLISLEQAKENLRALQNDPYVKLQQGLLTLFDLGLSLEEKLQRFSLEVRPFIVFVKETEFQRDLNDLEKFFQHQKLVSFLGWKAVDTDGPEDLLLCGTEVLGSCQSVHGNFSTNKCLLGYLLDGKNRLLAIKNAGGKIMARCIVRVLWDDVLKTPVLFQERQYSAPGLPKEATQVLDKLAQARAQELGIPLAPPYPNPLISYNTKAPFEYVDALAGRGQNINNGEYVI